MVPLRGGIVPVGAPVRGWLARRAGSPSAAAVSCDTAAATEPVTWSQCPSSPAPPPLPGWPAASAAPGRAAEGLYFATFQPKLLYALIWDPAIDRLWSGRAVTPRIAAPPEDHAGVIAQLAHGTTTRRRLQASRSRNIRSRVRAGRRQRVAVGGQTPVPWRLSRSVNNSAGPAGG
jgi:hypothetical protein